MPARNSVLEEFVYRQLIPLRRDIFAWSEVFGVDPAVVAAVLVVERQQYHLPQALRAIRRAGHSALDLLRLAATAAGDNTGTWRGLVSWLGCSRGFCRIKFDTAAEAWRRHRSRVERPVLGEMDICHHEASPALSVAVSCMILDELARQWEPVVPDIRQRPEILATLYNVSDFANKPPHADPRVGGSVLDVVVDGIVYHAEPFGIRVVRVMQSRKLRGYLWGKQ